MNRKPQLDLRSASRAPPYIEDTVLPRIKNGKALRGNGETKSERLAGTPIRGQADTVIFDGDSNVLVAGASGRHTNESALGLLRQAMANRVLHERLDRHRRHENVANVFVYDQIETKPIAKANSLNGQIVLQKRKLLKQGHQLTIIGVQGQAKEVSEMLDHVAGADGIGFDLRGYRVEGVEKEMWINLQPQGPELGLCGQSLRPLPL